MAYFHVTIVESAGSQANGGDAAGPSSKYVIDGQEIVTSAVAQTSTVVATAAHLGSWWRVALHGSDAAYAECAVTPALTSRATGVTKGRLFPPGIVEYHKIIATGEKWTVIGA
jgi:hypothetical protein